MAKISQQKARINLFEQLTAFYELIWFSEFPYKSHHVSLYIFLLNQNNRSNWSLWFDFPFDLGKKGSCIGSKKTYYQCLKDLEGQKLIKYEKGANEWRAPRVQIAELQRGKNGPLPTHLVGHNHTASDTSSEPQVTPQGGRDKDSIPLDLLQETKDKEESFESWWKSYGKKGNRKTSLKRWKALNDNQRQRCLEVVGDYVKSTPDKQYRKNGEAYLNQECWEDEIEVKQEEQNFMANGEFDWEALGTSMVAHLMVEGK